jgi:hypothetical protein
MKEEGGGETEGWTERLKLNVEKENSLVYLIVFFSGNPNINNVYLSKCIFLNIWN